MTWRDHFGQRWQSKFTLSEGGRIRDFPTPCKSQIHKEEDVGHVENKWSPVSSWQQHRVHLESKWIPIDFAQMNVEILGLMRLFQTRFDHKTWVAWRSHQIPSIFDRDPPCRVSRPNSYIWLWIRSMRPNRYIQVFFKYLKHKKQKFFLENTLLIY